MKRLAFIVAVVLIASVAYAVQNPDPVRNNEEHFRWIYPQHFNQALNASFVDAGVVTATTFNVTTDNASVVKAGVVDAGGINVEGRIVVDGTASVGETLTVVGATVLGVVDAGPAHFRANVSVAGNTLATGTLGVTAVTTLVALDAGVQSKVGGVTIGGIIAQDGGLSTRVCQYGYGAMTANALAVTFTRAFSSNPSCFCTHVDTTNTNPCTLTAASVPTTTTASFSVASGGTDVVHWQCCGDL